MHVCVYVCLYACGLQLNGHNFRNGVVSAQRVALTAFGASQNTWGTYHTGQSRYGFAIRDQCHLTKPNRPTPGNTSICCSGIFLLTSRTCTEHACNASRSSSGPRALFENDLLAHRAQTQNPKTLSVGPACCTHSFWRVTNYMRM